MLCEFVKSGAPEETRVVANDLLEMSEAISNSESLMGNTLVRKYRTKLLSRIGLRMVPPRQTFTRLKSKHRLNQWLFFSQPNSPVRALDDSGNQNANQDHDDEEDEVDIPEELDDILDALLRAVQDRVNII